VPMRAAISSARAGLDVPEKRTGFAVAITAVLPN
jgi:hypothetical protein